MEHGGLYVLVLLGLLGVASVRSEQDVTHCWVKGKEMTINPNQCPAQFAGVDAKFCCRLCYGANCCRPKKARVNLAKCPRDARLAGGIRQHRAAPDVKATDSPPTAPDVKTTGFTPGVWTYVPAIFLIFILACICVVCCDCCRDCIRCWEYCCRLCKREDEEAQALVNIQPPRAPPDDPPRSSVSPDLIPPPCAVPLEPPPPYSLLYPEGAPDLPPAYPGEPRVAFRRSGSRGQDDAVVILPPSASPPAGAASGSSVGAAETGRASEAADVPGPAADVPGPAADVPGPAADVPGPAVTGSALEGAASGGAPKAVDPPEAAASGGTVEIVDPLGAAASGGALWLPE